MLTFFTDLVLNRKKTLSSQAINHFLQKPFFGSTVSSAPVLFVPSSTVDIVKDVKEGKPTSN